MMRRALVSIVASHSLAHRKGAIAVMVAIMLTLLLGLLGLVLDTGLLLARHRQTHNAADAAALAAALDKLRGKSDADAIITAGIFANEHGATIEAVNIPPQSGPYAGNSNFVEVYATATSTTLFMQVLGADLSQPTRARAVAGFEAVSAGEGVAVLDPDARPGIGASGNGSLRVNGRVVVNSEGGGVDENGAPVNNGNTGYAARPGKGIWAQSVDVVGGVENPEFFATPEQWPNLGGPTPVRAKQLPEPDPLVELPVPTIARGVDPTNRTPTGNDAGVQVSNTGVLNLFAPNRVATEGEMIGSYAASAGEVILHPGLYNSIDITGGKVYLVPGIYVIKAKKNNQSALKITGGTVSGNGVLFYNTGHNFNPQDGTPDINDKKLKPPVDDGATLGGFTVNDSMQLSPIDTENINYTATRGPYTPPASVSAISVYNGMLFFQRRRSTQTISINGGGTSAALSGTLYAKWANFTLAGQGAYDAQFVAGSISITGLADVTVLSSGKARGKANQLFLVE